MNKKINILFIIIIVIAAVLPLTFANKKKTISQSENRPLADFPYVFDENGKHNKDIKEQFNTWLKDNIGFRDEMVKANAFVNYKLFNKISTNDYYVGKKGVLNYATEFMIQDFQHKNLHSGEEVKQIADSYKIIDKYLNQQGIQPYFLQCYDKHSIYPEWFMNGIYQYGTMSKTNQIAKALEKEGINYVLLYDTLMNAKKQVEVFSEFGDPTHWNDTGAYLGYKKLMQKIAENNSSVEVLEKDDYIISNVDTGLTLNNIIHFQEYNDVYTIKNPKALEVNEGGDKKLGSFGSDPRHRHFINSKSGSGLKMLVIGDSYVNGFLIDDFAESFDETWMIWGDYIKDLPRLIEEFKPDIILFENAERVDRFSAMVQLANELK